LNIFALIIIKARWFRKPQNFPELSPTFWSLKDIFNMAVRVVEFSNGGYKIRKIFA
jgi:hypothetical protein